MADGEDFHPSELDRLACEYVKAGFLGRDEIIQSLIETFEEDLDIGKLRPLVVQAVDGAVQDQKRAEAEWPLLTDCDRLDEAFDTLDDCGIVARHNFTCCQNCGHAEIGEEIQDASERGVKVRGYAFYHQQDTTRAVDGDELYLAYGALDDDEGALEKVAQEIVAALERCGLKTIWNGSAQQRIGVSLEWRRRFPNG